MKTRSLCIGAIRAALVLVAATTLAVCAPPLDTRNEGNLRIVLAGGTPAGARALSPETIAGLSYRLDFSGPNGETLSRTLEPGTQTLSLNLTLGDWTIQAEAFNEDGVVYGNGETTVTVEAGRINDAMIPMREATPEDLPKEITAFSFDGLTPPVEVAIDAGTKTVMVTVPYDTVVTSLVPTITVSSGASIDPASGDPQDFSGPVTYTVTAGDGSAETWTVTVTIASSTAKEITGFSFEGLTPPVEGIVDPVGKTVDVMVPSGTVVTNLVPTIAVSSGASVSPASGDPQDFTNSVSYTVTAEDGSIETWTVTVTIAPSTAKEITGFSFTNPLVTGTIDPAAKTVAVIVPSGTVVTNLTPTITFQGSSISPASGDPQDFTNPVSYTVTAGDGSTETWTVTVTIAPSTAKEITGFSFDGLTPPVAGTVDPAMKTVAVTVPYGTVVTNLTPTITFQGSTINPASGTAQNFTSPVPYTVTAEDGSTETWTVTVTIAPNTAKEITGFSFNGLTPPVTGTVDSATKTVAVTVPYGTVVTGLVPTIAISSGAAVNPTSGDLQNFTNPVTYTVTAEDGSTETWTVTVTITPNTAKEITAFSFTSPPAAGTVDPMAKTIAVSVFDSTDRTNLVPTITVSSGATVSPLSGTSQNFTGPVIYTVTAEDGSIETWTVTVTVRGPLTTIAEVTSYLTSASDNSTTNPVPLPVALTLSGNNWQDLLGAINTANKYVDLDLSACTMSSDVSGGGLYSDGTFDPDRTDTNTGRIAAKGCIISLLLPNDATIVQAGPGDEATFKNFTKLKSVTGTNITSIGWSAFMQCTSLTSVNFPSVQSIDGVAFADCTSLTMINIPASLTSIHYNSVFGRCTALTSFIVDAANPNFSAQGGMLLNKAGTTLIAYPSATGAVTLPATITNVGDMAFSNCYALTSVNLSSVQNIGWYAFDSCMALTTVEFPVVQSIANVAFSNCSSLTSINIPASLTSIVEHPFRGCTALTNITADAANPNYSASGGMLLNKTGTTLIVYPSAVGALTLPADITNIGASAFSGCTALTSVSSLTATNIDYGVFSYCTGLILVDLSNVTNISSNAFYNCTALTTVNLPNVVSIGLFAFGEIGTTALTITLGATVPTLGSDIFMGVNEAKPVKVRIPSTATADYDSTSYIDTDTATDNWGNAFRGKGWDGTNYLTGEVNANINLTFETYTP